MRLIEKIDRFVYKTKRLPLILIVFSVYFIKTGIWYAPNIDGWWPMSLNPFRNPFSNPLSQYLFWNWLGPFLAWLLHIHNPTSFMYFHLCFAIAFTLTFLYYIFSHFEENDARTALILFLSVGSSAMGYYWIGMDSITLALIMFILAAREHPIVALFLGIALGMQHFEQGFFAFGAVLFALVCSRYLDTPTAFSVRWSTCAFIGVLLGKLTLVLLFRHLEIHITDRRYYLHRYHQMFLEMFYYHTQYILWSFLGAAWLAVAKFAEWGKSARPFLISLAGLMLLQLTVGDETRVFWIVSFPLLAVYLLLDVSFLRFIGSNVTSWIFAVWLFAPFPYSWGGRPLISIIPYNIQLLLHRWFGWFSVPPNQSMWPFS